MGKCWNCEKEITLKDEETICDNCGKIVAYKCWSCNERFEVVDKETLKKLKECVACKFFICPSCGICGNECPKIDWKEKIKEIHPDITTEQLQKLVDYIAGINLSIEKRDCEFGVPISYAKGRIKQILVKMEGFKTKGENDAHIFEERLNKLISETIGNNWTVEKIRENGSYGQEYRDIFNLGTCMGLIEIEKKSNKEGIEYNIFTRCNNDICPYFDKEKLIINTCKKCHKEFPKNVKFCDKCVYIKGKRKNISVETNLHVSNKDTCQLPRRNFKTKNEIKEEKEETGDEDGE